jgi:hypothetical protein
MRSVWTLTGDGPIGELTFATPQLAEKAERLKGRMVVVFGQVGVGSLCVDELIDAATAAAEFQGKLERQVVMVPVHKHGPGPHTMELRFTTEVVWKLVTPNGTHRLQFIDQKVVEKAEKLAGGMVTVSGLIHRDGHVLVIGLSKAAAPVVRVQGKVQWVVRHFYTGELLFICDKLPEPISRSWSISLGLTADGKTRDLVFSSEDLHRRAESLAGQTVEVAGTEQGQALSVNELKPLFTGSVKQTVEVEIVGDLSVEELLLVESVGHRKPIWTYTVSADGKQYRLVFVSKAEVATLAQLLNGRRVRVTGTLDGQTVTVSSLKEEGNTSVKETVKVEITGVLRYVESDNLQYARHPWQITAEGKTYRVDFVNISQFMHAQELVNEPVVLTGTLKDGVVTVDGLRPMYPKVPPADAIVPL